ncbi:hypothetical protein ABZ208_22705 [Streptomyces sp. NPDC006208]|uniref:hypothetical protein n=1 Tax=unclassified Streptomyces TaxID=2593676 RepID=UPI002E1A3C72
MNTPQDVTHPVVVTISGCSKEDADTVFHALGRSFASDRADDDSPEYVSEDHMTVWTATFDVARPQEPAQPVRLESAVTVGVQGGYWAVDRVQETLIAAFDVEEEGMAAGDQEKDVQLRLQSGVHQ